MEGIIIINDQLKIKCKYTYEKGRHIFHRSSMTGETDVDSIAPKKFNIVESSIDLSDHLGKSVEIQTYSDGFFRGLLCKEKGRFVIK